MPDGEVYLALFPVREVREGVFLLPGWGQVYPELARVIRCRRIRVREDRPGVSGGASVSRRISP